MVCRVFTVIAAAFSILFTAGLEQNLFRIRINETRSSFNSTQAKYEFMSFGQGAMRRIVDGEYCKSKEKQTTKINLFLSTRVLSRSESRRGMRAKLHVVAASNKDITRRP